MEVSQYVITGWYRLFVRKDTIVGYSRTVDKLMRQFERETGKRPFIMNTPNHVYYYVEFWTPEEAAIWKLSNADQFINGEI